MRLDAGPMTRGMRWAGFMGNLRIGKISALMGLLGGCAQPGSGDMRRTDAGRQVADAGGLDAGNQAECISGEPASQTSRSYVSDLGRATVRIDGPRIATAPTA